jgi:uncharacterized protein (TIGR00730 family)
MENRPDHEPDVEVILRSPSYRLAYRDVDFLSDPHLRPVRMQLELLKPEMTLERCNVRSTIVVFGSTRIAEPAVARRQLDEARRRLAESPDDRRLRRAAAVAEQIAANSHYYETAREFAALVSCRSQQNGQHDHVMVTGGGPGIMEAANRGAYDVGAKSIGLNIRLPHEQSPNAYITPELCFQFDYFAMRKLHFLLRAKALVVFPGGFGTLDELFDALTLRQTGRMQVIPIILFGREYWSQVIDFQFLADQGVIDDADLDLIQYAQTAEEAWEMIVGR